MITVTFPRPEDLPAAERHHDGRATLLAPEPVGDAHAYLCHPGLDVPFGRYTVRYPGTAPIDQYAAGDLRRDPMAFDTLEGSSPFDPSRVREDPVNRKPGGPSC